MDWEHVERGGGTPPPPERPTGEGEPEFGRGPEPELPLPSTFEINILDEQFRTFPKEDS